MTEGFIKNLKEGDEQAWESFYTQYFDLLRGFCCHFTSDIGEAEDLAQDSILRIREKIKLFDEKRSLKPWVYQITRNICLNFLNKKNRGVDAAKWAWSKSVYATTNQLHIVEGRPSPPSEIGQNESIAELNSHLDVLSDDHRIVLLLKYSENLSRQEIAEALDIPLATVKSRLYHALKNIREKIDKKN